MSFEVLKYPEWRQLMAGIRPLLETKSQFSYDELKALAGVDIQHWRGRAQFYQFRKHALKEWQIWFENIPGFGYAVIPAGEHPKAAIKRVGAARRRVAMARAINTLAQIDQMTTEERALQAQTAVLLHHLSQTFHRVGRQFAAAATKMNLDISVEDLKRIADRTKKSGPPAE